MSHHRRKPDVYLDYPPPLHRLATRGGTDPVGVRAMCIGIVWLGVIGLVFWAVMR